MPQTRRVPAAPDAAHDTTFDPFGQLGGAFSWDATPHPEASTAAEPSGSSEDPAEHASVVGSQTAAQAASKQKEWIALDGQLDKSRGHRNSGTPPASAFKIPALGEEVVLATSPTSITRDQFWWVMEEWIKGGESYIKSVWRTRELHQEEIEDWKWTLKFRPPTHTMLTSCVENAASGDVMGRGREGGSGGAAESSHETCAAAATARWAKSVEAAWLRTRAAAIRLHPSDTSANPPLQSVPDPRLVEADAAAFSVGAHAGQEHAVARAQAEFRHILRRMDRKDVVTAEYLDEWCSTLQPHAIPACGGGGEEGGGLPAQGAEEVARSVEVREGVYFTPVLPRWVEHETFRKPVMSYLPYNYPKSRRYGLWFVTAPGGDGQAQLRMSAHLFDAGSREFLATSAQRMLTKIEKWGRCVTAGVSARGARGGGEAQTSYVKRVEHDALVPQPVFRQEYQRLKAAHKHWAQQWPEKTDPQKFVFEETGIAAFLLALWRSSRFGHNEQTCRPQTFVDLGCGNGFLTHLLTVEGFVGVGIDRQRRKIWDVYGGSTSDRLKVEDIDPETCVYPDVDWVIGNHSDELTPWLPSIAKRCGRGTRYFVIPCCFWDYTRRYTKKAKGKTRYETYLDFIHECGHAQGFNVFTEALRIPSTKNMAQVGEQMP